MEHLNKLLEYFSFKREQILFIAIALLLCLALTSSFLIQRSSEKQQIFSYLKAVQPIEDEFYQIVHAHINYIGNNTDEEHLEYLKSSISHIDKTMERLIAVKADPYISENKLLFIEEMKTARTMLLEQIYWYKERDEISREKSKLYYREYLTVSQLRRDSLKRIFDHYEINYLDLGGRIKYKTKGV